MLRQNIKNTLTAIIMAVVGFILLNISFVVNWAFQAVIDMAMHLFTSMGFNNSNWWYPAAKHSAFIIMIAVICWRIYRLKIGDLTKATFLMVPTAVVLATIGIFLYQSPMIMYATGALAMLITLITFRRAKLSWHYYYAVIITAVALLIGTLQNLHLQIF